MTITSADWISLLQGLLLIAGVVAVFIVPASIVGLVEDRQVRRERRRGTPDLSLLATAGDQPIDLAGGWRYESLHTSYANIETRTKAAEAGVPRGLLVTERPVTTPPWHTRPGRSEIDLWEPPDYRAASGNPLPQGWARAECVGCERRTLVNTQRTCVDCAGRIDLRAVEG